MIDLVVIGGGLAGSEAAWQAAQRGLRVALYEMRPAVMTGAHQTGDLAELVCSNSLGSRLPDRASGLLQSELRRLDSLLLECAEASALPAGSALAVDRAAFARRVTERVASHPRIEIRRRQMTEIPSGATILASGPLTSPALAQAIAALTGEAHLHFYDAIAPIVRLESVNMAIAFRASRYGKGKQDEGDYVNCPLDRAEYEAFVAALVAAERIPLRDFEQDIEAGVRAGAHRFFEGCLPVEVLARRGSAALAFGPLRPVGLADPRTGKRPYAVVQLRQDNLAGSLYNLVGFQTNLAFPEQQRVLRMIPGLENAEFVRYGQMHRNTFIAAPKILLPTLQCRSRPDLFFAGQLTGVEGYLGNAATGLLAGWNAARLIGGQSPLTLPVTTMLGALCHYITHASLSDFQPMKANFGILPPIESERRIGKRERAQAYAGRARQDLEQFLKTNP
jgi:methylenetetrahydrofolate--tRNA-(uracil-5-)-methyltransferase